MKLTAMIMTAALAAAMAAEGRSKVDPNREVVVCMQAGDSHVGNGTMQLARFIAGSVYAKIGVKLTWHGDVNHCPANGMLVTMSYNTPETLRPGALAYAMPFEGVHIRLFFDRISQVTGGSNVGVVAGYVLAHEIGHILQGVSRHSPTGVMKAHWKADDFGEMNMRRLQFESQDVFMIENGLATRTSRSMLAMNQQPASTSADIR